MARAQILLADDDRVIRVTLAKNLRQYDFDVIEASNGKEAVKLGCDLKPDIAIMDFQMPDITGVDAAQQLRDQADVSCIFLSAYSDDEFVSRAAEAGALGYLVKTDRCSTRIANY